jgi:Zn-dependent protease/CBS domain-containing protein
MRNAWRVGKVFGIDIRIDSSWLVIFVLVTWFLAGSYFPGSHPHWSAALNWAMGLLTSLFFFGSVLAHELTHSIVAIKQGEKVKSITLFILGGVAQIADEPNEPLKEFAMAVVGPLSSFVLAAIFFVLHIVLLPVNEPLGAATGYLAFINLALGAFNLLPGFPMDGGRVFRAILWKITGDLKKATRIASMVGDAIAFLLIFLGIVQFLRGNFGGLWLVLIGWFLHSAAAQSYSQMMIKSSLEGMKARDLMNTEFETVPAGLPVQTLVDDYILKKKERVFLVTVAGDLKGIVCLEDVKSLAREEWSNSPVSAVMTPKDKLHAVSLDTDGSQILATLASKDIHQVPVMDGDKVAGIICRTDLLRVLQLRSELGS